MRRVLPVTTIFLVGFLIHSPSFLTSIHGDEWKSLWLIENSLHVKNSLLPLNAREFPYAASLIALNLLSRLLPMYSGLFYFFAFTIKVLTSCAVFLFIKSATKNELAGYASAFLFLISPIGIESYIWARNFDSYLGMIILLYVYIKTVRNELKTKRLILGFLLILTLNTTRSHGALLLLSSALLSEVAVKKNKFKYLLSMALLGSIFFGAASTKYFGGQAGNLFNDFEIVPFTTNLLGNIGKVFVFSPTYMTISYLSVLVLLLAWKFPTKKGYTKAAWRIFAAIGIFIFIFSFSVTTELYKSIMYALFFLFFLASFAILELLQKQKASFQNTMLIIFLCTSFLVVPMIRQPSVVMSNEHRYIVYSGLVVPFLAAFAIENSYILKNRFLFLVTTTSICALLFISSKQTLRALDIHKSVHSSQYTSHIWENLVTKIQRGTYIDSDNVIVIADLNNHSKVGASLFFGGSYHFGLRYKDYSEEKNLKPVYLVHSEKEAKEYIEKKSIIVKIYK